MRISDWSSDVCSSDLRFAAEKVYAFELGAKFSGRRWSANIAAFREEFSNFQLNTFNGTSFVVQNINGCGAALTAGRCDSDDVEAGLISQGFELEMTATPIRNLRSEEHTSELQSLMRRSYADLSLTQTKKENIKL